MTLSVQLSAATRAAALLEPAAKKAIAERLKPVVIDPLVRDIRQAGSLYGGQSAAVTRSVKGRTRGFTGRIDAGGGMVVGTQGHPVTAGELIFGTIFGAERDAYSAYKVGGRVVKRRTQRGFPARNPDGWWFAPQVEREGPKIMATLAEAVFEALGETFDG